jgi:hypothetical protein
MPSSKDCEAVTGLASHYIQLTTRGTEKGNESTAASGDPAPGRRQTWRSANDTED